MQAWKKLLQRWSF